MHLPSMKQLMYQVEFPFVAVAWPLQDKVTIGSIADKEQPHSVIKIDGLFLCFFTMKQYGDAIRLGYLSLVNGELILTWISVTDYHEKKQPTFLVHSERIDHLFDGLLEVTGDISLICAIWWHNQAKKPGTMQIFCATISVLR